MHLCFTCRQHCLHLTPARLGGLHPCGWQGLHSCLFAKGCPPGDPALVCLSLIALLLPMQVSGHCPCDESCPPCFHWQPMAESGPLEPCSLLFPLPLETARPVRPMLVHSKVPDGVTNVSSALRGEPAVKRTVLLVGGKRKKSPDLSSIAPCTSSSPSRPK